MWACVFVFVFVRVFLCMSNMSRVVWHLSRKKNFHFRIFGMSMSEYNSQYTCTISTLRVKYECLIPLAFHFSCVKDFAALIVDSIFLCTYDFAMPRATCDAENRPNDGKRERRDEKKRKFHKKHHRNVKEKFGATSRVRVEKRIQNVSSAYSCTIFCLYIAALLILNLTCFQGDYDSAESIWHRFIFSFTF